MEFTYSTLNFWRKLIIWFQFFGAFFITSLILVGVVGNDDVTGEQYFAMLILALYFCGQAYLWWYSLSKRKMWGIWSLLGINVLTLNIIFLLICLSVIRVTKREIRESESLTNHEHWTLEDA